jgi:hypothetical protein
MNKQDTGNIAIANETLGRFVIFNAVGDNSNDSATKNNNKHYLILQWVIRCKYDLDVTFVTVGVSTVDAFLLLDLDQV